MKHTSIKLETPCEFINITPLNPLISKCQIKVCYVGDDANRNRSIITKDVAKQMANSLPGSPIVGFFSDKAEDFEEHNRVIDISNGKFEILIDELSHTYDYIILDTAPLMLVTDSFLISDVADVTLYVSRSKYTEKSLLDFANKSIESHKIKNVAFVLNDVDKDYLG